MDHSLAQYFGTPSKTIDANWESLLHYEYPAVSNEEMTQNPQLRFDIEHDKHPITGKFHVALDVFHNLHCLNAVRKELDKDYYGTHHSHGLIPRASSDPSMPSAGLTQEQMDAAQRDHIDHCMNHIRQALQCRPDLSPAAMHVIKDTDGSMYWLGNAKQHSCYNWANIMDWGKGRTRWLGFAPPGG
jgi:hypothetical protein